MNKQDKAMDRDVSKTDISNMPNGEFKAIIIRILTGLENQVEDISETINTEIRNNRAEIKDSINKLRNRLNGMNSRLEEAEERINDLDDRVTKTKQAEQNGLNAPIKRYRVTEWIKK